MAVGCGSLLAMLDSLDDRGLCAELNTEDRAELKASSSPSLLMPPPPPRSAPAVATPSPGSGGDDWLATYSVITQPHHSGGGLKIKNPDKASSPQLLTEQLSPLSSPHLTDLLTTGSW